MKLTKLTSIMLIAAGVCAAQFVTPSNPNPNVEPLYPSSRASGQITTTYVSGNQTTSIASVNLTCPNPNFTGVAGQNNSAITAPTGVVCPAGLYRVSEVKSVVTAGAGSVTSTLGWHDAGATQGSAGNVSGTLTISGTNQVSGAAIIHSDGSANLTYLATLTSTGTFQTWVTVERIQ